MKLVCMPTKEEFEAYEKVRLSGKFNMVTEWPAAAEAAGLQESDYFAVIRSYSWCVDQYMKEVK